MTRARTPRPAEIQAAARDPRLSAARIAQPGDSWRTEALCRNHDPDAWFPSGNDHAGPAVAVCRTCDVESDCLAAALDIGTVDGVWGATTQRERSAMLVSWRGRKHLRIVS